MKKLFFLLLAPFALQAQPGRSPESLLVKPDAGLRTGGGLWKLTTDQTNEIWYVIEGELTLRVDSRNTGDL